jgi:hypothetical protein
MDIDLFKKKTNNMKQTAVEWLVQQFETIVFYSEEAKENTIEQAKEMEKQQIIEARVKIILDSNYVEAEQYYKETFKNK